MAKIFIVSLNRGFSPEFYDVSQPISMMTVTIWNHQLKFGIGEKAKHFQQIFHCNTGSYRVQISFKVDSQLSLINLQCLSYFWLAFLCVYHQNNISRKICLLTNFIFNLWFLCYRVKIISACDTSKISEGNDLSNENEIIFGLVCL